MPPRRMKMSKASSSSARPTHQSAVDPIVPAPAFTNPAHTARYNILSTRHIVPNRYLDPYAIQRLGIVNDVNRYLSAVGWEKFSFMQKPSFETLTLEFLSTLFVERKALPASLYASMKFNLFGRTYTLTTNQLNDIFGFADDGVGEIIPDFKDSAVWYSLSSGGGTYSASNAKSSHFIDPAIRYLQRFMSYTICGRGDSNGSVTRTELFFLYCMQHGIKINTGIFLSLHLDQVASNKRGKICAGGIITAIAEAVHGFNADTTPLRPVPGNPLLDIRSLKSMGLVVGNEARPEGGSSSKRPRQQPEEADSEESEEEDDPHTRLDALERTMTSRFDEVDRRLDVFQEETQKQHNELMSSVAALQRSFQAYFNVTPSDIRPPPTSPPQE